MAVFGFLVALVFLIPTFGVSLLIYFGLLVAHRVGQANAGMGYADRQQSFRDMQPSPRLNSSRSYPVMPIVDRHQEPTGKRTSLLSSDRTQGLNIDRAIKQLGRDGSIIGTAYHEITYNDVVEYIRANGCRITTSISNPHNGWTEFEHVLSGQRYHVTLSRTHDGDGSVLKSKKI